MTIYLVKIIDLLMVHDCSIIDVMYSVGVVGGRRALLVFCDFFGFALRSNIQLTVTSTAN